MRKGDGYTIGFAAAVCVACSLLLAMASALLREPQERNRALDRYRNILKAFGRRADASGRRLDAETVQQLFEAHIRAVVVTAGTWRVAGDMKPADAPHGAVEDGTLMPLYIWEEAGRAQAYAFPVIGKGLWGTINGYLALEEDRATIRGITFYEHAETPGLGGEIEKDWFQRSFEGKRVRDDQGDWTPLRVVKGKVADKYPGGNTHAVDGISGATKTSEAVEDLLNEDVRRYVKYFDQQDP